MVPEHIQNRMERGHLCLEAYIRALKDGTITTPQRFVWETEGWEGYGEYSRRQALRRIGSCGLRLEMTSDGYILHPLPGVPPKYPEATTV